MYIYIDKANHARDEMMAYDEIIQEFRTYGDSKLQLISNKILTEKLLTFEDLMEQFKEKMKLRKQKIIPNKQKKFT